jgi:hypothetical protein
MMGGSVPSLEWLSKVRAFADKWNLRVHMDGARAFNALGQLGIGIKVQIGNCHFLKNLFQNLNLIFSDFLDFKKFIINISVLRVNSND